MRRTPSFWIAAAALIAAVLAAYAPALGGALLWDDDGHVTRESLRSLHGLWQIWFQPGATQQYYPVLHTAFWIEHRLWGDATPGYHLTNALLHALSSILLYRLLLRLEVRAALFGAFAFALHPVCVESVAWISEQKNTLSTVLYLAAALAYLGALEGRFLRRYALATGLFVLALLSKSVTASLPAALLVVLAWKGRLTVRTARPLAPWLLLSAAAAVVTPWVEAHYVGASGTGFSLGWPARILVAGRAVWFYFGKLVWPAGLTFVYPRWELHPGEAAQYGYPAALALALAALGVYARRNRAPLVAALLFVGALFPALGFVNVYPFVFSYVADHFQYLGALAMLPALAALLAWAWADWLRLPAGAGRFAALCGVAMLGVLTARQCTRYRDQEGFYRAILERNPECWLAHDNLGVVLVHTGRVEEAVAHYREAIRLNPDYPEAYNNLGNVLAQARDWDGAAAQYALALQARPLFPAAEYDWGNAMNDAGRYAEAEVHLRSALSMSPAYPKAHYALGNALANSGRLAEAVAEYEAAVALDPSLAQARANLGFALVQLGRAGDGIARIREALALRPSYAEAHVYLGLALASQGEFAQAVSEYREALRTGPDNPDVHYHMAMALRKLGDLDSADRELSLARGPVPGR